MQYSDTTNKDGILQECERYTAKGDAAISGDSFLIKQFTAMVNKHNRRVWHTIFESYGGWQYDDGNQTDLPAAADTLTADKTSYALPSDALTIRGIEIKDSNGVWTQLSPLTEEQIREREPLGEFYKTSGIPEYYQVVGDTVRIFPAANWTQASSFKVFFDRGSVEFASTDTTETPGFVSEYHDILPIGASIDWLKVNRPNDSSLQWLQQDYNQILSDIKDFYTQRLLQLFPPRIAAYDKIREVL